MYLTIVFLHIVGVFGFLLAHGASALVGFKLREERKPERIRALLDLSASSRTLMYSSLGLLLVAGIVAGFLGHWWGRLWIWCALALLVLIVVVIVVAGLDYFRRLRSTVEDVLTGDEVGTRAAREEELAELLRSPRPRLISLAGSGILVVILYLMMFKPF